jgi:spore coat protein U-like protein
VPSSITLTSGANSLTVTTSASASGAQVLSGAIGAAGAFTLKLGGSLPVTSATPSGTYSGTVSVTVAYN